MFHGIHGEFRWLESAHHSIPEVLEKCPNLANGKGLVITAYAGGPPLPSEDDTQRGWRLKGSVLYLPNTETQEQIPREAFKEWYIFNSPPPEREFAVFANYDWFTLGPAIASKPQANSRWDLRRIQRIFWQVLESASPESYLACGNRLIFATQNQAYFSCVLKGLSALAKVKTGSM
jgi:hypothetical protein